MSNPLHDLSHNHLNEIKNTLKKIQTGKKLLTFIIIILALACFPIMGDDNDLPLIIGPAIFFFGMILVRGYGVSFKNSIQKEHKVQSDDLINVIDTIFRARRAEQAKNYEKAITIWEGLGVLSKAARTRELQAEMGSVKVAQKVVQGDQITKTEIKDSVLNRSNVGGGSSKMQELEKLTAMKEKGLIDDDEFKQMKKEILGK